MSQSQPDTEARCVICKHYESQHLDVPAACADCLRENRHNAYHRFKGSGVPDSDDPTQSSLL